MRRRGRGLPTVVVWHLGVLASNSCDGQVIPTSATDDQSSALARGIPGWWVGDRATVVGSLPGRRHPGSELLKIALSARPIPLQSVLQALRVLSAPRSCPHQLIKLQLNLL
jgi:hypothetical protein